ncbi:MAG: CHAT domain-containing protein [Saprospiraceae bacterium]
MLTTATKFILDMLLEHEELKNFPKEFVQEAGLWVKSWFLKPEDPKSSAKLLDTGKPVEDKIDIIEDILKELENNRQFQQELAAHLAAFEEQRARIKNVVTDAKIAVKGDVHIGDKGLSNDDGYHKKNVVQGGHFEVGGGFRLGDDFAPTTATSETFGKTMPGPRGIAFETKRAEYPKGDQIISVPLDTAISKPLLRDIPSPIKVLFLAATPKRLGQINTGRESRFSDLIREFDDQRRFAFDDEHGLDKERFRNLLIARDPHIIHFGGHGHYEGLALDDTDINANVLTDLIKLLEHPQLVILNACYTLPMAREMAKYVPYVIGTQGPLDDDAAIAFARSFYVGIASGKDIKKAFQFGLNGIQDAQCGGGDIPVLVEGVRKG